MKLVIYTATVTMFMILTACNENSVNSNNVAVLDMEVIFKATGQDTIFAKQMKQADIELSNQIKQLAVNLDQQLQDIKKDFDDKPTDEQKIRYQQNIQQANNAFAQTQNLAKIKLQQYKNQLIAQWSQRIQPIAQTIARDKGANILMASSPSLLWFESSVDITDEVLAEVRKQSSELFSDQEVSKQTTDIETQTEGGTTL